MSEGKNPIQQGQSAKKTIPGQKPATQKPQTQPKPSAEMGQAFSLIKRIEDIGKEIENKPLKSFEKKDKDVVLQSYEKLITGIVRQINNSRI
jgi:hypothetical protein